MEKTAHFVKNFGALSIFHTFVARHRSIYHPFC